jgi:tRNA threonylcarbamoyladenosine biosynthesis protein TsaE
VTLQSPPLVDAEATRAWGARLGALLHAGDLVILTGGLGAGKTTLTQGIAEGLGVRGPVTSPTFVIARVHPSLVEGPVLVHVDAYRLGGLEELDDLDLDADLDRAVTVVEWGHGIADDLSEDALEVVLEGETVRTATVLARGERWTSEEAAESLAALAGAVEGSRP